MIWNSGMAEIVSNTSPLLYLYRIQVLDWLPSLGSDVWIPKAVELELEEGRRRGYDVPDPDRLRLAADRRPGRAFRPNG